MPETVEPHPADRTPDTDPTAAAGEPPVSEPATSGAVTSEAVTSRPAASDAAASGSAPSDYRLRTADPEPTRERVSRLTCVPFFHDGTVGVLGSTRHYRLAVVSGPVPDPERWLLDSSLRIPLDALGFRIQSAHVFAAAGPADRLDLHLWHTGDHRADLVPRDPAARLVRGRPDELAARLRAQGDAHAARLLVDAAADRRAITDERVYADNTRHLQAAYLDRAATGDVRGGSGFGGTAETWLARRGHIADAVPRSGTFLDLGCANGLLMESVAEWTAERGLSVEPFGVDLAPGLVAEARRRLPRWADRIHHGNALTWRPADGRRFTSVYVLLDAVPDARRRELVEHARELVEPGGRLLVGHYLALGASEPDVVEQLATMRLPAPDGYSGTREPESHTVLAWYDL